MTKVCPHCWRKIRIRKDGTFARHSKLSCDGSFEPWRKEPKLLAWPYPKVGASVDIGYATRSVEAYVQLNGELFAYISGWSGSSFVRPETFNTKLADQKL